jgi:hypothetical protein
MVSKIAFLEENKKAECAMYEVQSTKIEQKQEPRYKRQDYIVPSTCLRQAGAVPGTK